MKSTQNPLALLGGDFWMKRTIALAIALLLLAVPVLLAKDVGNRGILRVGEATFISETEFTVPLSISHDVDLAAMDIPLEFSKGLTLQSVSFEQTAVADFDFKIANIDNELSRVNIGLIKMVNAPRENPYLKPARTGANIIATLTFRIDDVTLDAVEFTSYKTTAPVHDLMFVYNEYVDGVPHVRELYPELAGSTVALSARTPTAALPKEFALMQNVPNPFNPSTMVSFALPVASKVNLSVYNVLGQHVKVLVDNEMNAGVHSVTWDGTDNSGRTVASGVYFYKLRAADFTATKKMMMLK